MKKVVVFGGGTGLSCLLDGLKLFPIDVTAVISVSDNGSSAGQLKKELDIPAVGDVGQVLVHMANVDEDFKRLLGYRFKESFLENHPIKNILLAALIDIKGNLTDATKYMCELLNIKGTILPLSEDKVELVGEGIRGQKYLGEESVSQNIKRIKKLKYDHDITVPHLIAPEVNDILGKCKAPIMYISNLVTQPGETDGYSVSDHLKVLNKYLKSRCVDVVISNDAKIDKRIIKKYSLEHKELVKLDTKNVEKTGARVISDKIYSIEDGSIRHDALKTAFLIFSYLMEGE